MSHRPPLLFLHGAFAGPEIWTRFVAPWFARRGHRVAVPHLPGPTDGPARLRDYVRTARVAAGAFGVRPVAVGHSLGGFVAQHLAAEGRLAGAVLVASPGPFGLGPILWRLSSRAPDVLAALMVAQAGAGALLGAAGVRRVLFTDDTPDAWIRAVAPAPRRESNAALLDGMSWDLPFWPSARPTPMLALLGDRDAFVSTADLMALAAIYGAETELLANRGHGTPIDPHWRSLAWRIDAWLGERAGALAKRAGRAPLAATAG